jgi:hypothetical protein
MVTVHGGNKPHRLGAEIHRERGKNLGAGRETSQHGAKFFNLPEVVCDLVLLCLHSGREEKLLKKLASYCVVHL